MNDAVLAIVSGLAVGGLMAGAFIWLEEWRFRRRLRRGK